MTRMEGAARINTEASTLEAIGASINLPGDLQDRLSDLVLEMRSLATRLAKLATAMEMQDESGADRDDLNAFLASRRQRRV